MLQTFRLLLLGWPGSGKSDLMGRFIRRSPVGGVIADPLDEFEDAPDHFIRFGAFDRFQFSQLRDVITDPAMDIPAFLFMDEFHQFVEHHDNVHNSELVKMLDIARNLGIHAILATKQATLLPPLITTIATHVAINPPRTPAVLRWCRDAGIDIKDMPELPDFSWIVITPKGGHEIMTSDELLGLSEQFLDFGKAPT